MKKHKIIYGNWKMNHGRKTAIDFFSNLPDLNEFSEVLKGICPQSALLSDPSLYELAQSKGVMLGAQNCSSEIEGALTGENSAALISELGARFVLLGHSERRQIFSEEDEVINQKIMTALSQNLQVVVCVGETLHQRNESMTLSVLDTQLETCLHGVENALEKYRGEMKLPLMIAYEPVWAIGTGEVASIEQIIDAHSHIKNKLGRLGLESRDIPILYGGSVKPSNAQEILKQKEVDGALVGGASLRPDQFTELCRTALG